MPELPLPTDRVFHFRADPCLRVSREPLQALVKSWYLQRGTDGLPPRSAFEADVLKPVLPHVLIVEFEPATQRYRYRLVGTAITEAVRRNVTGRYADEIYAGADLEAVRRVFDAARLSREPTSLRGRAAFAGRAVLAVDGLLLPVGTAAGGNPQLIGALYFSNGEALQPDLWRHERAHSAA